MTTITIKQLQEYLPYTGEQIRRLARQGNIPSAFRIEDGRMWLFNLETIKDWIISKQKQSKEQPWPFIKEEEFTGLDLILKESQSTIPLTQQINEMRKNMKQNYGKNATA